MGDTGFGCRVTGIVDDAQIGLWPGPMQIPCAARRTHYVVAALHDHPGNAVQQMRVAQNLTVLEKTTVVEVMVLDPREREGEPGFGGLRNAVGMG